MATYVNPLNGNTFPASDMESQAGDDYAAGMDIGANIRRLRKARGRSLKAIEYKTGIDRSKLSAIESGRAKNPTLKTLRRIAEDGLGLDVAALFSDPADLQKAELLEKLDAWRLSEDPGVQALVITVLEIADATGKDVPTVLQMVQQWSRGRRRA